MKTLGLAVAIANTHLAERKILKQMDELWGKMPKHGDGKDPMGLKWDELCAKIEKIKERREKLVDRYMEKFVA